MTPLSRAKDADALLQACRRELNEALEQQAATREILGVISRLQADPQPAFEAIVAAGVRLFGDAALAISRPDGDVVRPVAIAEADNKREQRWAPVSPSLLSREYIHGAAMLDCRVIDVPDLSEPGGPFEVGKRNATPSRYRAMAAVPLVREGKAVGAIALMRVKPGRLSQRQLTLLQTLADQALIAIENARLFDQTRQALQRQTATAEVLHVISGSVTDAQPVFDVIAERAARLTGAKSGWVFTFDGEWIREGSAFGLTPDGLAAARALFPMRPGGGSYTARAIGEGRVMNVADALAETDPRYLTKPVARQAGYRSVLSVPMFKGQQVLGAISVNRAEVGRFDDKEVELLRTFADQAVIAIENTRLSREREARNRELAEALEQQTATGEILRVIACSPTDVQPVFDTIAQAALRLCEASIVNMLTFDGELLHVGALVGLEPRGVAAAHAVFPRAPGRDTVGGMAVLTREVFVIEDVLSDEHYAFKSGADWGLRSALGLPLLRDGKPIGALAVCRPRPGSFDAKLVALLRTFADQAVIALENVRLFNERETRNRELAIALEQQTATSEILRVIARSTADVQPVFDTIAAAARRLCQARAANVLLLEGGQLELVAEAVEEPRGLAALRIFPRPVGRDTAAGRAVLARQVVEVPDVLADAEYGVGAGAVEAGFRSALGVPLLRDGVPLGAIVLGRREPGALSPALVGLLRTFADQAVIAIENTRLFNALQDKTRELEIASRHKSAFLANMSHELRTPLNAILGFTRIVLRETRGLIVPKQAENLEKILASARHLVGVINATLDLTRIEAGRIEITPSELALAPLLDECLRSVEPLAAEGVSLQARVPPDLPPLVVDVEKLRQILLNLLGNAVKFTERGSIELRAAARESRVVIEVQDTGIGIPADKLEAVFEEFEQVDAGHARAHGGTGLGLAIARRLARAMGGELSAVSALGKGSTFTLDLPWRWKGLDEA